MNKFYVRLLLLLLGMGFCIFFGVELASRGVEQIQGPIVTAAPQSGASRRWAPVAATQEGKKAAAGGQAQYGSKAGANASAEELKDADAKAAEARAKKEAEQLIEPREEITETSGVTRIGNKAGDLLQIIAHHGIRLFVAILEAISG